MSTDDNTFIVVYAICICIVISIHTEYGQNGETTSESILRHHPTNTLVTEMHSIYHISQRNVIFYTIACIRKL